MNKTWHFGPSDDDEYNDDDHLMYDENYDDEGPEYDQELDFNPRFGGSILDQPDSNDEIEE